MTSLLIGSALISLLHALIPNHWLPLAAVAKAEKWDKSELILISSITASAHVLGTAILGIILGLISSKLAHQYDAYIHVFAPVLLIVFGLIYFTINMPHHQHATRKDFEQYRKSKRKWIIIFVVMMFFSPLS